MCAESIFVRVAHPFFDDDVAGLLFCICPISDHYSTNFVCSGRVVPTGVFIAQGHQT